MKKVLCIILLAIGITPLGYAQADWYQVEVYAFKRVPLPPPETDTLADDAILPDLTGAIQLIPSLPDEALTIPYQLLSPKFFSLGKIDRILSSKQTYIPLLHVSWLQPITDRKQGKPVHLFGGATYDNQVTPWELNGIITLTKRHYIQVTADLVLNELTTGFYASFSQGPRQYLLKQSQRFRNNELHYFDHPAFGLLVLVRPYHDPEGTSADLPQKVS